MSSFNDLRSANVARQKEWDKDNKITLAYRGNELAGEVGEACNVIKKIDRERIGLPGSRASRQQLAEELADVVICADLIAMDEGIDLFGEAVPAKFNTTSEKVGLVTRLVTAAPRSAGAPTLITRPDVSLPILSAHGKTELAIRAGTVIRIDETEHAFPNPVTVPIADLAAGRDYAITLDAKGEPIATPVGANPLNASFFAGFHFAPGGHAQARSGGDSEPAINPFSLWDLDFRPSCPDPRGMTLVEADGIRCWFDIYLLGTNHKTSGTSHRGATIADGWSLDKLDYETAKAIMAEHGKRLPTYDEFRIAAYGVTEKSAAPREPEQTCLDAPRTSRFGLMQATGNMHIWGTDGDPDFSRPSIFGGSWLDGAGAGSRYADLDSWPGHSDETIGARGACDHLRPV
jgi:NTP pyrophosphatase (non-canonical NTP hydrolase)